MSILIESGVCYSAELTSEQQQILQKLDSESVDQIVEVTQSLASWRDAIRDFRHDLASADMSLEGENTSSPPSHAAVIEAVRALKKYRAVVDRFTDLANKLDQRLKTAVAEVGEVEVDEEIDLTREQLTQAAQGLADYAAAAEMIDDLEMLLKLIDDLKDPTDYAQAFLKSQFEQWLGAPQEHELLEGLKFTIKKPDSGVSVFDPAGGLVVVMEYAALDGAKIEATGLYFEYDPSKPIPKPNISKLKVQTDWKSLLPVKELSQLGGLSANLGMGFTLSEFELPVFDKPDLESGLRGGIKFKAALKLSPQLPTIEGRAVVYPQDLTIRWIGDIKGELPLPSPYPIGTTGAAIHKGSFSFTPVPGKERVAFGTVISTVAPNSWQAMNLDVELGVPLPVREIDIKGSIKALNNAVNIGDVEGKFDFSRGKITSGFRIPGKGNALPIGSFFSADGDLELSGKGLHAEAQAKLFGQAIDESVIDIDSHGNGTIATRQSFSIAGISDFEARLDASFTPGFERLQAHAVGRLKGVNLGFFDLVDVALEIDADSDRRDKPVRITGRTWRVEATVELVNLAEFDLEELLNALRKEAIDVIGQVAEELANAEAGVSQSCKQAEADFRAEVYRTAHRYGIDKLATDIPAIDGALKEFSEAGKKAADTAVKEREKLGKIAVQLRENPGKGVEAIVEKAWSAPGDWGIQNVIPSGGVVGGAIGGLFGSGKKKDDGPSQAEINAAKAEVAESVRRAVVAEKTNALRNAIAASGSKGITKTKVDKQKIVDGRRLSEQTELNLQFRNPAAALEGKQNALLTVVIPAAGFTENVRTGSPTTRKTASDFQVAQVRFERLVVDPENDDKASEIKADTQRPTARISVPQLKHGSEFPAERIAHVHLQELLERYMPEVEILGPKKFVESQVAVKNSTDEVVEVWVKSLHRKPSESGPQWIWSPSGPNDAKAFRYRIKPGETQLLSGELLSPIEDSLPSFSGPLKASRVRIWAESEGGERWMEYRDHDLKLITPDPALEGEPGYFADSIRTFTHVIRPRTGIRVYNERILKLTNKTSEPLTVRLQYRSTEGNVLRWRKLEPFQIPAGATGLPTSPEGMKIRASQIRLTAEGQDMIFSEHENTSKYLVEATDGRRLYSAKKASIFEYVFQNPGKLPTK